jgi:hypothetical protein
MWKTLWSDAHIVGDDRKNCITWEGCNWLVWAIQTSLVYGVEIATSKGKHFAGLDTQAAAEA